MKKLIIIMALAASLGGCASLGLQDPWAGGKFNASAWTADIAKIKAAVKADAQVVLDTMDQLCPEVQNASRVVNDPVYSGAAQSVFGVNAATKKINAINDGLLLLGDACTTRNADSARKAIVSGATAINDAKRIFAAAKK